MKYLSLEDVLFFFEDFLDLLSLTRYISCSIFLLRTYIFFLVGFATELMFCPEKIRRGHPPSSHFSLLPIPGFYSFVTYYSDIILHSN